MKSVQGFLYNENQILWESTLQFLSLPLVLSFDEHFAIPAVTLSAFIHEKNAAADTCVAYSRINVPPSNCSRPECISANLSAENV